MKKVEALKKYVREYVQQTAKSEAVDEEMRPKVRQEVLDRSLDILGCPDVQSFLLSTGERIAKATFLAGAGSRWVQSLAEAGAASEIDPGLPRAAARIADIDYPGHTTTVGSYALRAAPGLGRPYVIWGSQFDAIERLTREAGAVDAVLVQQVIPQGGAPLGHGDALRQLLPHLSNRVEILVTQFSGDPNSGDTLLISCAFLLAMQTMRGSGVQAALPVALLPKPPYPIALDADGYPVSFGQARLQGNVAGDVRPAWSNVGLRLYTVEALWRAAEYFRQYYDEAAVCYRIPGNLEMTFGLDNLDQYFAGIRAGTPGRGEKRLALLGIAAAHEIAASVKRYQDIPGFLECLRKVRRDSRFLRV